MKHLSRFAALWVLVLLVGANAFAQTTASLSGTATSEGKPLPGVTVTISSPNLQGTRSDVTDNSGAYQFAALPPGEYTVKFELSGLATVTKQATLKLSQTARADADLKVSGVTEAITVTAAAPTVLETPQVASNMTLKEVEKLPVARNQLATALLAPGVNPNTPSANQLNISGSPGYDNLVLVNGVVVTENVRSQMRPLYVEDAIQETTVLTGAISAEYGRFTGGVVNTITKSGGNTFSGSFRDSLTNAKWVAIPNDPTFNTPSAHHARVNKVNPIYEATLGGFIMKDRLWFFGAGRKEKTNAPFSTLKIPAAAASGSVPATPASDPLNYSQSTDAKRYEGKLTGQITPKHSIVGSYLKINSTSQNTRFTSAIYDLASLTPRSDPESLASAHYSGVITSNFLLEGQWSQRKETFANNGARFTDLIKGTLLLDRANGNARFNSATFCGVCTPETRNNHEYLVKGNYFLNTMSLGNHNIIGGYDNFQEKRFSNNHQSGSDFRLFVTQVKFFNGQIYPIITPTTATGAGTFIRWTPIDTAAAEDDLKTQSVFANDKWDLNPHWSFNVGIRYDKNHSVDAVGVVSSNDNKITPRLTAIYDIKGDGRHRVTASFNQYASRIVDSVAAANSPSGVPATIDLAYKGPAINTTALDTSVPAAIQAVFDYFRSQQCAGSADPHPCTSTNLRPRGALSVPGYSSYFDGSLVSPYVNEYTAGYGAQIGATGFVKVDFIARDWKKFYAQAINQTTRQVVVPPPLNVPVDLALIVNSDNIKRKYRGMQIQSRWNPSRFQFGLNYTYSTLKGNDEGETANNGPIAQVDPKNYYPEYLNYGQYIPQGYLSADQRHRARAWVGYDVPTPALIGHINLSVLENYDSGLPYSMIGTIDAFGAPGAPANTHYKNSVLGQYYFSSRGAFRTPTVTSTNLAVRYSLPITKVELFAQGDLLNAFNERKVATNSSTLFGTVVQTSTNNSSLKAFNPFHDTPVLGVNYQPTATFGKPLSKDAYQTPRTYRFSFGVRF